MKRKSLSATRLVVILLLVLLAGCGNGGSNGSAMNSPIASTPRQSGPLQYSVTTNKSIYMRGENVHLAFSVKNIGIPPIDITLAACEYFDIKVSNRSQTVWQLSQIGGCGGDVRQINILPGETITFEFDWDQKDQQGNPVPAGQYSIQTWFMGANPDYPTLLPGHQEANEYANPVLITVS